MFASARADYSALTQTPLSKRSNGSLATKLREGEGEKGNVPARTGKQYIEGLRRESREVWINGERVADVTAHPAFKRGIESIAQLYDLQHDPKTKDKVTYPSPSTGDPVSVSFLQCRSVEDLKRRYDATLTYAETSGGMLGRMPDFLNSVLTGFAESYEFFARGGQKYADNLVRYYEYVRENDLCLT